jgi:hypothetical protein
LQSRSRSAHDSEDSRCPTASNEFFAAIRADTDHHQQADLALVQANLVVDPVDPDVDVIRVG